jgi:mRNA interferase MazF
MDLGMIVNRFEIWLVNLDPTIGSEITKTRPCVIVSPNEMNKYLQTVLIAPLTHIKKMYPSRIDCILNNQSGQIVLDQIRAIDKTGRLVKKVSDLDEFTSNLVCNKLVEMFEF